MTRYVNLVGSTVTRQASRDVPYRFGILDTEVVTALSLPGGYVFLTRGALANMRNEAELAGTLAHEVAHVDGRHLEREVRSKKSSQFAKEEATARVPQGSELVSLAGDLVNGSLTMQVSRDKETEADKVGTELAARAGYDPAGLKNFLEVLAQAADSPQNHKQLGLVGKQASAISRAGRHAYYCRCRIPLRRKNSAGTIQLVCKSGELCENWRDLNHRPRNGWDCE